MKKYGFHAEGKATFYIEVEAKNEEEAMQKIKDGKYESDQTESWVEEVDESSIEELDNE